MFDFSNVEVETTVPVGLFNVECIKAERMKSKSGKDMVEFGFEIFGEKYQGYKLRKYMLIDSEYTPMQIKRMCDAAGMEAKFADFNVFVGKKFQVKTDKEVQGDYTNAVIKYFNKYEAVNNSPVEVKTEDIPF